MREHIPVADCVGVSSGVFVAVCTWWIPFPQRYLLYHISIAICLLLPTKGIVPDIRRLLVLYMTSLVIIATVEAGFPFDNPLVRVGFIVVSAVVMIGGMFTLIVSRKGSPDSIV